jgi:hypothetical protein
MNAYAKELARAISNFLEKAVGPVTDRPAMEEELATAMDPILQRVGLPLAWTTTVPTVPGFYWAGRGNGLDAQPVRVVGRKAYPLDLLTERPRLMVEVLDYEGQEELTEFRLWAGPIEPPALPAPEGGQ